MRADYRAQISALVRAVEFTTKTSVSWCGKPANSIRVVAEELVADALTAYLTRLVYQAFYVFGQPLADLGALDKPSPRSGSARFVERLLRANAGRGTWEQKASLEKSGEGREVVRFAGVQFVVPPEAIKAIEPGGQARLVMPGELLMTSPGHVLLFGDAGPRRSSTSDIVRFYWNVTAEGAPRLVEAITAALNSTGIPFELKIRHTDQPWTLRADPAVLYLDRRDVNVAWPLLSRVQQRLVSVLRASVPALTLRLSQGLGVADDPPGKLSFGLHRSQLIAEGLTRAHLGGRTSIAERVDAVAERFAAAGLSLDMPYVNPGGADLGLPAVVTGATLDSSLAVAGGPANGHPDWVAAADRLGARIAEQALWQHDRCTWLQRSPDPAGSATWRSSGPEFYDGLSGIALMFAQLWVVTGHEDYRRHAYGALRHACDRLATLQAIGLYAGATGAGLGIALAAKQLHDDSLLAVGTRYVTQTVLDFLGTAGSANPELLYGAAGALLALIGCHRLGEPDALEIATRLGKELVSTGSPDGPGMSWTIDGGTPAVGLAHGASGVVLALAELASATGDNSFCGVAELGCCYERTWFDPDRMNWADLHESREDEARDDARWDKFCWCYGAPGIALARLALQRAGSAQVEREVADALAATRHAAVAFPRYGHDVCLCHGAAGLAEILSLIPPHLSDAEDGPVARRLLSVALDAYQEDGPWLAGCGLMTGAGGLAYAALRAIRADLVSPLLLLPADG